MVCTLLFLLGLSCIVVCDAYLCVVELCVVFWGCSLVLVSAVAAACMVHRSTQVTSELENKEFLR